MTAQHRYRRLEALLWLIVTCVVLAVFLGRISFYTESAELRAIEITLSQLRAAIELHRLRSATGIALEGTNPMRLLAVPPGNYAGEFASIASAPAEPGTWFYDRQSKKLVYVLLNAEKAAEKATPRQQKMLHFKLELRRLPKTSARPSEPPADNAGVVLNQLDD